MSELRTLASPSLSSLQSYGSVTIGEEPSFPARGAADSIDATKVARVFGVFLTLICVNGVVYGVVKNRPDYLGASVVLLAVGIQCLKHCPRQFESLRVLEKPVRNNDI